MCVLVGAPPSSIGNYGKDTDNWMWPASIPAIFLCSHLCGKG
ncbi:MAG: S46 family peptidase [Chitinophagaceae bacterium]|nr:S46 family peptidase [Chitinophagaceae bacterium]